MRYVVFALWGCCAMLLAAPAPSFSGHLEVNNRILLKVGGKPISVMDVVRKMDLLFYQQYPQLVSNPAARYEFYTMSWRNLLAQVIDDKLISADAEEKKVEVTDGEVREELEKLFGPSVVATIDQLGLTLEEAWDLVKTELTVQKMNSMMVYSKALAEIHPSDVKKRYEKELAAHPPQDTWVYQMLSVKAADEEKSAILAGKAHELIVQQGRNLASVHKALSEEEGVTISLSAEYTRLQKEISAEHRAILEKLQIGQISAPVMRKGGSTLFYLKEHKKGTPPPFQEAAARLKNEIINEKIGKYNLAYRQKLREHYGLTPAYLSTLVPEEMNPFALR